MVGPLLPQGGQFGFPGGSGIGGAAPPPGLGECPGEAIDGGWGVTEGQYPE